MTGKNAGTRCAAAARPETPSAPSEACRTFLDSMNVTYDQWRDGIGYDLDALARIAGDERRYVAGVLVERVKSAAGNWRDVEALAALDQAGARTILEQALETAAPATRLYIARLLVVQGVAVEIDRIIADILRRGSYQGGLSLALDLAAVHATPYLRNVLLDCARDGHPDVRVHAAALCLYLARKAEAPFDLSQRPFFLQFGEEDRATRARAFEELCRRVGAENGRWPEV